MDKISNRQEVFSLKLAWLIFLIYEKNEIKGLIQLLLGKGVCILHKGGIDFEKTVFAFGNGFNGCRSAA